MWNWSRDSSNHGGKKESYNKIALALLGRDDGRFLILCFNLVKSLTRIIKICLASLGVWTNILKALGLGVGGEPVSGLLCIFKCSQDRSCLGKTFTIQE